MTNHEESSSQHFILYRRTFYFISQIMAHIVVEETEDQFPPCKRNASERFLMSLIMNFLLLFNRGYPCPRLSFSFRF